MKVGGWIVIMVIRDVTMQALGHGSKLPQPIHKEHSMPTPERIWLEPDDYDPQEGRMWCEDPDPDDRQWVEYVRADIVLDMAKALNDYLSDCSNDECIRCIEARNALFKCGYAK
jgi:hypothetical protein